MKKIFLDNLPKKIRCKKECIDWINSIGYNVRFIYDDIEGEIHILEYVSKGSHPRINVVYENKIHSIGINGFSKCEIGKIIGKHTKEFKIEIGQVFKDDKRDLIIIDREYRKRIKNDGTVLNDKWYKYHCSKCGAELWIIESGLLRKKSGCGCCSGRTVVKGINDIATIYPHLVKYFVNIEDAYIHTFGSGDKILMKCPNCGFEKELTISNLYYQGFSCQQCSDGVSYPEKVMYNLLKQLNMDFVTQYNKTNTKWCGKYRYDFYFKLNNEEYIIETHGLQHYEENTNFKMPLKEVKENDKDKKELAIKNGIKPQNYIVVDCRYSDLNFIKNNILHSRLNEIFNLNNINWIKIGQDSEKSLVKEVCDYWHLHNEINNEGLTTKDLSIEFKLYRTTIIRYLKKGVKLNWCNYNPKEEFIKHNKKLGKSYSKIVEVFKNGVSVGVFESVSKIEKLSNELFGVKLYGGSITEVCNKKRKLYKGYYFEYK